MRELQDLRQLVPINKHCGKINRIKDTINKVLEEDTTLGDRLRTFLKEQDITIDSVLTAIGIIIGVIVVPTGGRATPPKPPSQGGVKYWIKPSSQPH